MNDNLKLWDQVSKTDPSTTKKMTYGAKLTAIDAYSQIRNATECFGPYGGKWGITEIEYIFVHDCPLCLVKARFKYPDGEYPVNTSISLMSGQKYDDDFAKKAETDLITKALSRLGFNADVFMGKFDDQKYVSAMKKEFDQMNPEPIDMERVNNAVEFFRSKIDEDDLDLNHEIIVAAHNRLTNDEKMKVGEKLRSFRKAPDSNKLYTTLLKDYLDYHPAVTINPDDFIENEPKGDK